MSITGPTPFDLMHAHCRVWWQRGTLMPGAEPEQRAAWRYVPRYLLLESYCIFSKSKA